MEGLGEDGASFFIDCLCESYTCRDGSDGLRWDFFYKITPLFSTIIGKAFEAYNYLPNSLTTFPDPAALKAMMEEVGWRDVGFYRLSRGMMAVHVGKKAG